MNTTKEEIKKIMDYYKEDKNIKFSNEGLFLLLMAIIVFGLYIKNISKQPIFLFFLQYLFAIYGMVALSFMVKYNNKTNTIKNGEKIVDHPKVNLYMFYGLLLYLFSLIINIIIFQELYIYFFAYIVFLVTITNFLILLYGLYPKIYFKHSLINYICHATPVLFISMAIPYLVYLYVSFNDPWYIKIILLAFVLGSINIGIMLLKLNRETLSKNGFNFFQISALDSNTQSEILKIMLHDEEVVKIKNDLYQKLEEWFPEDDKYKERVLLEVLANRYKKPNNKLLFILGSAIGFIILEIRSKVFDEYIYTPHIKEWIQNIF